jgi:hypothetical protein
MDVVFLPIAFTSCEEIATWVGEELVNRLGADTLQQAGVHGLELTVHENPTQSATRVLTFSKL